MTSEAMFSDASSTINTTNTSINFSQSKNTEEVARKSNQYGEFFCNKFYKRSFNMFCEFFSGENTEDMLYLKVYNTETNGIESFLLKQVLEELFKLQDPFPNKSINNVNQVQLIGPYYVNVFIYIMFQTHWRDLTMRNGFYVGYSDWETAYMEENVSSIKCKCDQSLD